MDRVEGCDQVLSEVSPDIVVDAAGPFQSYGEAPFGLVESCIEHGINYLDLADSRNFVCGIDRFNERAVDNGVFVLSGASSVPALSGAVIAALAPGFGRIDSIEIGITPAGGAIMGPNVVRAILSYAGQEVAVREEGRWQVRHCWTDLRPERLNLGNGDCLNRRRFSLCDVPDLAIWPARFEGIKSVYFGAALEPPLNHFGMVGLAWLVRLGLLRRADALAPVLHRAARWWRSGKRRGGMFVRVTGCKNGEVGAVADWTLLAAGDDGPYVPAMASAAIVARTLRGDAPTAGARTCTEELTLEDFETFFSKFNIQTKLRCEVASVAGG